jgi:hypothetical protein
MHSCQTRMIEERNEAFSGKKKISRGKGRT